MKKILPIILIICILAAVGVGTYLYLGKKEVLIEDVFPENALVYIRMSDLSGNLEALKATEFWQSLEKLNFKNFLEKSGVATNDIMNYVNLRTQLFSAENHKMLKKFFGKELAFALYSPDLQKVSLENIPALMSGLVLVTRLNQETKILETLSNFSKMSNASIQTQKIGKYTVNSVETGVPNLQIVYVRVKDLLIVGGGIEIIKQCISNSSKGNSNTALSNDQSYQTAASKAIANADMLGFVNFDLFKEVVRTAIVNMTGKNVGGVNQSAALPQEYEYSFKQMEGFQTIGFSANFEQLGKIKIDLHYDKNSLNPDIRPMYDCPPDENATLAFIPQDIVGYQWSTCVDLNYFWEQTQKELERTYEDKTSADVKVSAIIAQVERNMNLSFEQDILPAFGNEFGGYLVDIDTSGLVPIPKLVLFIKIADQDAAERILDVLMEQQPLFRPEQVQYQEELVNYVNIPLLQNLIPSYSFIKEYLLVSTDKQMLEHSIDVLKNQADSLKVNSNFQRVDFGLSSKNNSMFFLELGKFMNKAQNLLEWGNQWVSMQSSKQQAFKTGSVKRLQDIQKTIQQQEFEILNLKEKIRNIRKDLKAGKDVDTSLVVSMAKEIKKKEQEIKTSRESEKKLEDIVAAFDNQSPAQGRQQLYMEEFVKPLLKVFSLIEVFSARVVIEENLYEMYNYIQLK